MSEKNRDTCSESEEILAKDIGTALESSLDDIDASHIAELDAIRKRAVNAASKKASHYWLPLAVAAGLLSIVVVPQFISSPDSTPALTTGAFENSVIDIDTYLEVDPYFLETMEMLAVIGELDDTGENPNAS